MRIDQTKIVISEKRFSPVQGLMLAVIVCYTAALTISYRYYLIRVFPEYSYDFSYLKLLNGVIAIMVLAFAMDFSSEKPSQFFLTLHFFIGIIPLAIIYYMQNANPTFFNSVWIGYLFACILSRVNFNTRECEMTEIENISPVILCVSAISVVLSLVYLIVHNGMLQSWFLALSDVYDVRSEKIVISNKYIGYIFPWITYFIAPFLESWLLSKKQYFMTGGLFFISYVFFLYTGNKTILFSIPLVLVMFVFSRKKNTIAWFFSLLTLGVIWLSAGVIVNGNRIFVWGYSLICRRTLLYPADIKFNYHDYFLTHQKIGLYGLPIIGNRLGADASSLGHEIARIYYNAPDMNANTGFLVEGFSRFGYAGIIIVMVAFVLIIKLLDNLQIRTDYCFVMTAYVYIIYSLNDGQLLGSLMFGPMLVAVVVSLLFYDRNMRDRCMLVKSEWNNRDNTNIALGVVGNVIAEN